MMYWAYNDPWSWLLMAAMMLLFWGGVAALIVFVVRAIGAPRGGEQALEILRRRLASGEISQDEFEKTRRILERGVR
jgi:putative membrane protein